MIVLWIVLVAAVCFFAVIFIRAIKIKAKPAPARMPQEDDEKNLFYGKRLAQMVQIPTVTGCDKEFERLHETMRQMFPLLWSQTEVTELGGNLLFHWRSENPNKPAILFMGHQDVVPASDDGWSHKSFSGDIADGCVWGRGSFDCKATIFCEMSAVEELLSENYTPPCDVYIATSVNEETGGDGAPSIVKLLTDKGVKLAVALDEGGVIMEGAFPGIDRPFAAVGIMEKGSMNVRISAKSKGGHSSQPPKGTPIARLSAFVNEVETKRPFKRKITPEVKDTFMSLAPALPFKYRLLFANVSLLKLPLEHLLPKLDPMFDAWLGTTFCFTMCKGSEAPNVIPNEAYVVCNLRISKAQGMNESINILKSIAEKYDLKVELINGWEASGIADSSSEEYRYLEKILYKVYPDIGISPYLMLGGSDCRHYESLTVNALRITPLRINNQQFGACHGPNENITMATLSETTRFYKEYIKEHTF